VIVVQELDNGDVRLVAKFKPKRLSEVSWAHYFGVIGLGAIKQAMDEERDEPLAGRRPAGSC
jgi:hypothetical protein